MIREKKEIHFPVCSKVLLAVDYLLLYTLYKIKQLLSVATSN